MKSKIRIFVLLLLALVIISSLLVASCKPAGPESATWIYLNLFYSDVESMVWLNDTLPGRINEVTNGLVTVEWRPGLYSDYEFLYPLKDNIAQISYITPQGFSADFPEWDLSSVPFMFMSEEDFYNFMDGGGEKMLYNDLFPKYGLDLLEFGVVTVGTDGLWSKEPVTKVEDFQGKKIQGDALAREALKLLGATGMQIEFEEIFLALERGVMEGSLLGPQWGIDMGFYEVCKYYADWPIVPQYPFSFFVNKTAMESLPADAQRAVADLLTNEITPEMRRLSHADTVSSRQGLAELGVTWNQIDTAELDKASQTCRPVLETYANSSPEALAIVKLLEQTSGRTIL